jgi:hypothetical protein
MHVRQVGRDNETRDDRHQQHGTPAGAWSTDPGIAAAKLGGISTA